MVDVILIGDSIRLGYQAEVVAGLAGRAHVWGPEENGGTSANILRHLDTWLLSRPSAIVHCNCGLHDLKREFGAAENNVPLADYRDNLRQLFRRIGNESDHRLVWANTTPVDENLHHKNKSFDRFEADVEAYNSTAAAIAAEFDLSVNDLFAVMTAAGPSQYLQPDGVHFTAAGSQVLAAAVVAAIEPHLR